ncbi:hypothetical protein AA0113_g4435 [Alternaria arborescens]|uniref:EGF-like domain-containing protein n=1 Tax=Alternaria arborescens TaxID=156630 RepID=A0A4Q4SC59_9PLEO|nr:hypothetical protein AA0113_g4435 [Alternaria arborescens]
MKFLTLIAAVGTLAGFVAAGPAEPLHVRAPSDLPIDARSPQEGAGDVNTWFKDRFCASGFASCGKAGTNGDPGNRCALACENFAGGVALGHCQCSRGWYPDECITLGKYAGRHKC